MGREGNQGWNEPNNWAKWNEESRRGVVGGDVKIECVILEGKRKVDIFIRVRGPVCISGILQGKLLYLSGYTPGFHVTAKRQRMERMGAKVTLEYPFVLFLMCVRGKKGAERMGFGKQQSDAKKPELAGGENGRIKSIRFGCLKHQLRENDTTKGK